MTQKLTSYSVGTAKASWKTWSVFSKAHPADLRSVLARVAIEQMGARELTEIANFQKPEQQGLFRRLRVFFSRMDSHPMARLLDFPPRLPRSQKPILAEHVLQMFLDRRWEPELNLAEDLALRKIIPYNQVSALRRFGNVVLAGVAAIYLVHRIEELPAQITETVDKAAVAASNRYQRHKSEQIDETERNLEKINREIEFKKNDPVGYKTKTLTEEFKKEYGRKPTEDEMEQIKALAIKLVKSESKT
jgi:hypothetical protein